MSMKSILGLSILLASVPAFAGTCTYSFSWYENESVTDFTVPLSLAEGIQGFSYSGCSADGSDLRVFDGATALPYEIENWDALGKSVVWVKVPAFSKDTRLTLKWGEDAAGIPAVPTAGFWDDAFAVFHFSGETETNVNAVTGDKFRRMTSESSGSIGRVPGPVADAASFNQTATCGKWDCAASTYGQQASQFTISFWMRTDRPTHSNNKAYLLQWGPNGGQCALLVNWDKNATIRMYFNSKSATGTWGGDEVAMIPDTRWHHYVLTYDGSRFTAYRDGSSVYNKAFSGFSIKAWTAGATDGHFCIGSSGGSDYFYGQLDEMRVERVCRSADWVAACCETQAQLMPGTDVYIPFADYDGTASLTDFPAYVYVDGNAGVRDPGALARLIANGTARVTDALTGTVLPLEFEYVFSNAVDNSFGFWTLVPEYSRDGGIRIKALDNPDYGYSYARKNPRGVVAPANSVAPSHVWNPDDYLLVFHMNPTGLLYDVVHDFSLSPRFMTTSRDNDAVGFPVAVDGPTGPYQAYHSTTCSVQRSGSVVTINHALTNVYTISWWAKDDADEFMNPKRQTYYWTVFGVSPLRGDGYSGHGAHAHTMALFSGANEAQITIPDDQWHFYAYTADGAKTRCYRDGVLVASTTQVINFNRAGGIVNDAVSLMGSNAPKDSYRGCVDELRVEAVCRSADWLRGSYQTGLAWRNGAPWQFAPHFAKGVSAVLADGVLSVTAKLSCRTSARVMLCWAEEDCGDDVASWPNSAVLESATDGSVTLSTQALPSDSRFVYRLFAVNAYGSAVTAAFRVDTDPKRTGAKAQVAVNYTGTETLKDFPLCVRIPASSGLPADRSKVRFADENGAFLPWESEVWNPSGESVVWVKVPELKKGTTLAMRFHPSFADDGGWACGDVWDADDYAAVYHFGPSETSGVYAKDSTGPLGDITSNGLKAHGTNGVAGTAWYFPREVASGNTKTARSDTSFMEFRRGFTFSIWARIPNAAGTTTAFLSKHELTNIGNLKYGSGYDNFLTLRYCGGNIQFHFLSSKYYNFLPPGLGLAHGDSTSESGDCTSRWIRETCSIARPDEAWHQYVFVNDGMFLRSYLDGVETKRGIWPLIINAAVLDNKSMTTSLGNNINEYARYLGGMDEYRVERQGRSADWVKAAYDNQREGSTFVSVGAVERNGLILFVR